MCWTKKTRQFSLLLLFFFFFSSFFFHVSLWSCFESMAMRAAILQSAGHTKKGQYMWQVSVTSWADPFFCSSLVKSEPTWLRPKQLQSEVEFFFTKCCISIDSTTIMKPANGNGATFATFVGQLSRLLGACFKIGSSVLFQWLWWTMSPDKVVLVIVGNSATT